jgi:hypothetical protein
MKVTIWLNGKSRTYNANEIDVQCFPDGEEENIDLGIMFMMGETIEGQLSITGELPITINTDGRVSENQIYLDQPIPEHA